MPKGSSFLGIGKNAPAGAQEPLLFTVSNGAPKPDAITGSVATAAESFSDSYSTLFHWSLSANLPPEARITAANPDNFHSVVKQAFRPKEPAVHVKAFRGSKDGYLFFLENGILWGFKKPLLFIPLSSTAAISYCNVLRTTFNIVVEVFVPSEDGQDATEEIEFGMIDQADYTTIDENYVKKNRLQDRSMVEQRKAKKEIVENERSIGKKGKICGTDEMVVDDVGAPAVNGKTILEQTQWEEEKRLQDEEDEDEEDYDPGSDGDSDGSGSSTEEDDNDEDQEDDDGDDDE